MRTMAAAVFLVLVGLGIFEVVMQPSLAERVGVALLFGLMASAAGVAAVFLPRLARGQESLRATVMTLALVSLLVVTIGLVVAGQQMFISDHDLGLLLTVVGFGVAAGLLFAISVSRPLTDDLTRIASTASAIASGDLTARSGVARADEVGVLARAVDSMAVTLESAQQERAKDEKARRDFFAAVGHDLRTPLASLQLAVEAIHDGVVDDPSRYLESMNRDVEALSRLVEDLFLLARIESGDFQVDRSEQVDLTEVADEAIEVFRPIASERGVSLTLQAEGSVVVSAGSDAIARVIRNLVDNAIRHSPDGGRIVVGVSNGNRAKVSVTDEGEGFASDFAPTAFDRFTRDDRARRRATGGAGLGLAIAHGFVRSSGGEIWAEPGPGGKVGFTLPI